MFHQVRHHWKAQRVVTLGFADQSDAPRRFRNTRRDALDQSDAPGRQQGLVAPHAPTLPARKHETRAAFPACRFHETMVTSRTPYSGGVSLESLFGMLALIAILIASPVSAAERPSSLLRTGAAEPAGKISSVRVDRRTGKLVRNVFISGGTAAAGSPIRIPAPPARIAEIVEQSARSHGVDPLLVHSVIQVESNYNLHAVSSKGAEGLMQLMPGTSRQLRVGNSFDPAQNIEAGVRYLKQLQETYKDDRLALAAYNAGPGAVDRFHQVPPYVETRNYVEQVAKRYRAAKNAAGGRKEQEATEQASPVPASQEVPVERYPKLEQFLDQDGKLYLRTVQP